MRTRHVSCHSRALATLTRALAVIRPPRLQISAKLAPLGPHGAGVQPHVAALMNEAATALPWGPAKVETTLAAASCTFEAIKRQAAAGARRHATSPKPKRTSCLFWRTCECVCANLS